MPTIDQLISANEIQEFIQQREYPFMLGQSLFPEEKDDVVEIDYIIGAHNQPISASVRALDAETQIAGREEQVTSFKHGIYTIARKIPQSETQLLDMIRYNRDNALLGDYKREIFNDMDAMVQAVRIRVERMRMDALFSGKIELNENGYTGTVDYRVPEAHQIDLTATGENPWGTEGSDWVQDLENWKELLLEQGVTATRILTTDAVLKTILRAEVTKGYLGLEYTYLTANILNDWLTAAGLPTFATYDEMFRVEKNDGTKDRLRYVPEGKIALFGDGPLGITQYGVTAEEIELRLDPSVEVEQFGPIVGTITREGDPVTRWTKAVARALPSFFAAGEVIQAQVVAKSV